MAASQGLRLETARAEANHTEVQRKVADLRRQYDADDLAAYAELDEKSRTIGARFERQIADVTAQLQPSLRESIEGALREKKDLEIELLRRTHREQARARFEVYEVQKRKYDHELFKAITALMAAARGPSPDHLPALSSPPSEATHSVVAAGRDSSAETNPAPLAATEVPSQPQQVTSPLPTQTPRSVPRETDSQPLVSQTGVPFQTDLPSRADLPPQTDLSSHDAQRMSPRSVRESQPTSAVFCQQPSKAEQGVGQLTPLAQTPPGSAQPVASPSPVQAAVGHDASWSEPIISTPNQDHRPVPAKLAPKLDPTHKRKAESESYDQSPASAPSRGKRSKLDKADRADSPAVQPPTAHVRHEPSGPERTVSFDDVSGSPVKPAPYKHVIVQYPSATGHFYILRCDEHGVHFGEHPLRGAAKHLASAQHGYMSKAHATAIETLGHRVLGCTKQLADRHNNDVLAAFKGGYKAFNANNLSQSKRAELGFPPLEPTGSQKPPIQRKPTTGITDPITSRFYVTSGELRCPVLILPWGDTSPVGLAGTLADTGIFCEFTDDGTPTGIPKPPKCYVYDEDASGITGIRGWAKGYESGGSQEKKREFPVLCVESNDCRMWSLGWAKAAQLSGLDLDDPSSRNVPYVDAARDYFYSRVLRQHGSRKTEMRESDGAKSHGAPTPQHAAHGYSHGHEDVHMEDVGDMHDDRRGAESDRDSVSRAMTDSENGIGRAEADSRRTSVSNRDFASETKSRADLAKSTAPGSAAAQLIATQALNIPAPARGGFTAINSLAGPESSASRSARASLEPPSRAGSVSSAGGNHRRVFKIHARSSNKYPAQQTNASPSIVLPERPADGAMSPRGTPSRPQGDERKPSPASLQNILQDFPSPAAPRLESQSPKPTSARRPLPSGPMRSGSPSRVALLSAVNARLAEPPRDSRAGSAPAQPPQLSGLSEGVVRASGSASAAPGPSRQTTPQPPPAPVAAPTAAPGPGPGPEPTQRREPPPPPIQVHPAYVANRQFKTTPLATPTTSVPNTRANSPTLSQQPKTDSPTTASFPKPETPILTPTLAQPPAAFLPTMDVFDLVGFMDGATEQFRSTAPGQYLRLIDDHQSGALTTPSDSEVTVRIDPAKIKTVERATVQGGAVCVVTISYQQPRHDDNAVGDGGKPHTQTVVLEKARSTASGMQNGTVHARRLCRRLQEWNESILFPTPGDDGPSMNSVRWWLGSSPTPEVVATPTAQHLADA